MARRALSDSPPLATATFQMMASSLMMTVVAGIFERPWQLPMPGAATWLAVLGLAALSTALAYIVFFQILRRSGATNVMLVTLLMPVTAILLGSLVLGEQISPREIAGALVIGSALLLIDGRVLKFFHALSDLRPAFPFGKPAGESSAVALAAMPGRVHGRRRRRPSPRHRAPWSGAACRSPAAASARSDLRH